MSFPAWRNRRRVALSQTGHERPDPLTKIGPLLDRARAAEIRVDVIDPQHVRLIYNATLHDHWVVIDDIYEHARAYAAIEGDGHFDAAPDNWMGIHFDFASCEKSIGP